MNHFGLTKLAVTQHTAARLDRIARRYGCTYVGPVRIPGNDLRGWFTGPNLGFPHDQVTAEAVLRDVAHAGIVYPPQRR
jgi:hypothetical protein